MKKMRNALAALAGALALGGGVLLTSCSSGGGGGGGGDATEITSVSIQTESTTVKPGDEVTLTALTDPSSLDGVTYAWSVTDDAEAIETELTDALKAAKSLTFKIKDGATDNSAVTVSLSATYGEKTVNATAKTITVSSVTLEEEEPDGFWTWLASDNNKTGADISVEKTTTYKELIIGADANNKVTIATDRIKLPAREVPTANTWYSNDALVARTLMFTAPKGTLTITINAAGGSTSNSSNITLTSDRTTAALSKIFATLSTDVSNATYEDVVYTLDSALEEDTVFYLLNLKTASGAFTEVGDGGTVAIKSITVAGEAKEPQDAPTEANFQIAAPTSASGKGSVTIVGVDDVTTLAYKLTEEATQFVSVTESPVELAPGTYYFYFKKTDTKAASDTYAVTVPEYVNTELQAATAPVANSVTGTATTSAENNDGKLTVSTTSEPRALQYRKKGDTNWADFASNGVATGLTGGVTYEIRVKASEEYNASADTIEVVVKRFTAAPSADDFTIVQATEEDGDGTITLKGTALTNKERLEVKVGTTWTKWTALDDALSEDGNSATVPVGTYISRYAATTTDEQSAESAEIEIKVVAETVFTELRFDSEAFDAVLEKANLTKPSNKALSLSAALSDEDGTWSLAKPSSGNFNVKDGTNAWSGTGYLTTYDYVEGSSGYKYTRRFDPNGKAFELTLKVGAGTKHLRIDAGPGSSGQKVTYTITGSEPVTWTPSYKGTKYVAVTAKTDGTITLEGEADNKPNLYGVYVVSAEEATAGEAAKLTGDNAKTVYSDVALSLKNGDTAVADGAVVAISTALTASASTTPSELWSDGTLHETDAITDFTFALTDKDGAAVADAVSGSTVTVPATEGTYTLTASYKVGDKVVASAKTTFVAADTNKKYTVTFNANGGSTVAEQEVPSGSKATEPNAPTREDNNFGGWYTDEALTNKFDFDTAITANITLYAKWTVAGAKKTYKVTLNGSVEQSGDAKDWFTVVSSGGYISAPDNSNLTGNDGTVYAKALKTDSADKVTFTIPAGESYSVTVCHMQISGKAGTICILNYNDGAALDVAEGDVPKLTHTTVTLQGGEEGTTYTVKQKSSQSGIAYVLAVQQ